MSTFGDRLKKALEKEKTTQRALAQRAGISESHMSRLVSGNASEAKAIAAVIKMARALRVRVEWLATGEEPMCENSDDSLPNRGAAVALVGNEVSQQTIEAVKGENDDRAMRRSAYGWVVRMQALEQLRITEVDPISSAPFSRTRTHSKPKENKA